MTKPGEAELFKQARAGDKAAFSRLQSRLEPQARRFIWRLVGRIDEEDDIVQNAFVALYLNLGRLDSAAGLRPFLFRVVRNQCYDLLRRVGRYEVISIERPGPTPRETRLILADESLLPEEAAQWTSLLAELQGALDRLPELQRQTLILYALEKLSYAEIAEAMQVSLGTVKSRLHHARANVSSLLDPETRGALRELFSQEN